MRPWVQIPPLGPTKKPQNLNGSAVFLVFLRDWWFFQRSTAFLNRQQNSGISNSKRIKMLTKMLTKSALRGGVFVRDFPPIFVEGAHGVLFFRKVLLSKMGIDIFQRALVLPATDGHTLLQLEV